MYKKVVEGKFGIVARIVADSIADTAGSRIVTFELEYPRMIHSELMTHRNFSRNAMSSRAVPVTKMLEQVRNHPARPIEFGKNKSGMQSDGKFDAFVEDSVGNKFTIEEWWQLAAEEAADSAEAISEAGYHKQVTNRLLEPFQFMKTIVTSTEWNNFFWLRLDKAADPTIQELAVCMKQAFDENTPEVLKAGEWHTPYVDHFDAPDGSDTIAYGVWDEYGAERYVTTKEAIAISSSCCAQVSYRNIDNSYDKALSVYERLGVGSDHLHASPFEHQATPMLVPYNEHWMTDGSVGWVDGVTHVDKAGSYWSGNFKGWIQHRQLLSGHTHW